MTNYTLEHHSADCLCRRCCNQREQAMRNREAWSRVNAMAAWWDKNVVPVCPSAAIARAAAIINAQAVPMRDRMIYDPETGHWHGYDREEEGDET